MALHRPGGRDWATRIHRWFGLAMAAFLIVTGLTGSLLAFKNELDVWLNQDLFRAASEGSPLKPSALVAAVERADPRVRVSRVVLPEGPGLTALLSVRPIVDPGTGRRFAVDYDEAFVDPANGRVVGTRDQHDCCSRRSIMHFIYDLHFTLLADRAGRTLLGVIAVIWIVDCFIGFYLTLPRGQPFFTKWATAWTIKRPASAHRRNLDLHRAGGLWLWSVLLVLAVTSFHFGLSFVFRPMVELFSPITKPAFLQRVVSQAPGGPKVSFDAALGAAEAEATRRGWRAPPRSIYYLTRPNLYGVKFGEVHPVGLGHSFLYVDGSTAEVVDAQVAGRGTAGDLVMQAQYPLHSGQIAGLAGRIIVCLSGLIVAMLSVTGVLVWWRKRAARIGQRSSPS